MHLIKKINLSSCPAALQASGNGYLKTCTSTQPLIVCHQINVYTKYREIGERAKHKMLFYLQSFCLTESKNVATTLICATGCHIKIMARLSHSCYSNRIGKFGTKTKGVGNVNKRKKKERKTLSTKY